MNESEALFRLPFDANKQPVRIVQGFDGPYTHKVWEMGTLTCDYRYALDFALKVRSAVLSARAGIVSAIIDVSDRFYDGLDPVEGEKITFGGNTNFMMIRHDDRTYALYSHLHKGEFMVRRGERVQVGQPLALTGKCGWIGPLPHLHFEVRRNAVKSIPVSFENYNGPLWHKELDIENHLTLSE